jgi:hypothetical protein
MKTSFLAVAVIALSCASAAHATDLGADKLKYLPQFDPAAIRMLACSDMISKDGARIGGLDAKSAAKLVKTYEAAGRAAVVRAALEAPGSAPAPKVANISFTSKAAKAVVTNDLRVHEARAAEFTDEVRQSGFDVSSSCVEGFAIKEAESLNDWFAHGTSVLTEVK